MYKFEDIGFRPIDESDLDIIRKNRNDSDTLLNLGCIDLVNSEQQKAWWLSISRSKTNQWHCITYKKYENTIGVLRFQNIDYINKSIEIGADIFSEYRGKGFGEKTYKMALEYLFYHFNMNCVYLKVAEFNRKAITLYQKIGFQKTGCIPKSIYRKGKYWDNNIMALTADKYFK